MKRGSPRNVVASVQARLVERSRELRVEHQPTLAGFGGERLLYRLSRSGSKERFILKGAPATPSFLRGKFWTTQDFSICHALVFVPTDVGQF